MKAVLGSRVHFYLKSLLDLERRAFQMKHTAVPLLLILTHKSSNGDIKNMEINKQSGKLHHTPSKVGMFFLYK